MVAGAPQGRKGSMSPLSADVDAIAHEVLDATRQRRQITPFSERDAAFDLPRAYAVTAALRRLQIERGQTQVGRKIGFTNRTMWAEYGVFAPIWGDMYASSVHEIPEQGCQFPLHGLIDPRLEPEIAFGLSATPHAGMDERALLRCVGWVAHAYEVVQSIFPGWRFSAADVVASGGLHGALLLGPRRTLEPAEEDWLQLFREFRVELFRNESLVERGEAANVLDGPLSALRHLVQMLSQDQQNAPLRAGEIITTGSLTRAYAIAPGERWTTRLSGLPLPGLSVEFA